MTGITGSDLWEHFVGTESIEDIQLRGNNIHFVVRSPNIEFGEQYDPTDLENRHTYHCIRLLL